MDSSRKSVLDIRNHPRIPLIFAGLVFLVLLYSLTGQWKTPLFNERVVLTAGELTQSPQFTLDSELRYTLDLKQLTDTWKFNSWASLVVRMINVESEGELFELEDNYWAEHGIWKEDGASGKWKENNAKTSFNFRVAEPGEYRLETMMTEHFERPEVYILIKVSERKPTHLHWIPLLGGIAALIILSRIIAGRRQVAMCKYLEKLTAGSTLKIRGELVTVVDVRTHREPNEPAGFEWRLRGDYGRELYLAVETFEHYPEEEVSGRYLMLEIPNVEIEGISPGIPAQQIPSVEVEGRTYSFDCENSGPGIMETYFEGDKYITHYVARTYRPRHFPLPRSIGMRLVEHMAYERLADEDEWCVMEILSWKDIEMIHINKNK